MNGGGSRRVRELMGAALRGSIVTRDGEHWQEHWSFRRIRLEDGSLASGNLMRCKGDDGRWRYRRATPEELLDLLSDGP